MPAGLNVDLVKEKTERCETDDWLRVQFFQKKCEEGFIVSQLALAISQLNLLVWLDWHKAAGSSSVH